MNIRTTVRELATCYDWPEDREKAEKIIEQIRKSNKIFKAIDALGALLGSKSPNIRLGAAEALGDIQEAPRYGIGWLEKMLTDSVRRDFTYGGSWADEEDDRTPGQGAAYTLGMWKAVDALPALLEAASSGHIAEQNLLAIIFALGKIGDAAAIPVLEQLAHSELAVIRGGIYGEPETIPIGPKAVEAIRQIELIVAARNDGDFLLSQEEAGFYEGSGGYNQSRCRRCGSFKIRDEFARVGFQGEQDHSIQCDHCKRGEKLGVEY